MKKFGALPYQELEDFWSAGFFSGLNKKSIQPASIDLSITDEAYRIRGVVLPRPGEKIKDLIGGVSRFKHDLALPIEPDQMYLIKVAEKINLPEEIYGYTNPKSSSGRNDIRIRIVADGVSRFDSLPRGFSGELWMLISSGHFLIKLASGDSLAQLRLFNFDTRLDDIEMRAVYKEHKLLWTPDGRELGYEELKISDNDGSLILTIDLESSDIVGYKAKPCGQAGILVFNEKGHNPKDFFEFIEKPKNGYLMLGEGNFYIFYTKEWPRVPPCFAAEMAAMDSRSGEFRSHYAGFIDPAWGYGNKNKGEQKKGWPLVLEVLPYENNILIRDNQPIAKLNYERLRAKPEMVYGDTGSHYVGQNGAMLSKHFRPK